MRIDITAEPRFWFNLTSEQIDLIILASDSHYDVACKKASQIGGFIYGWYNQMQYDPNTLVCGSFREVDTVLKILEMVRYVAPDKYTESAKLCHSLRKALLESNKLAKSWLHLLEV